MNWPLAFLGDTIKIGNMEPNRSQLAVQALRAEPYIILPSLLMCDFGNLRWEIERLEEAGVRALHLDVMDGHFVPNLTYGMPVVEGIRRLTKLPIDVHLMISDPLKYVGAFADAGADLLTVHAEIDHDVGEVLARIRELGVGTGIAINPGTDLDAAIPHLSRCDLLLVMSVQAGFGGQAFNPAALDKLKVARSQYPELLLEVDGGVNQETIASCHDAGARLFVVGSAIFGQEDYGRALRGLATAMER